MSSSTFGKVFTITTWGESHGKAYGVVIDGIPSNLPLCEQDFKINMARRRPGNSNVATSRTEADDVEILSGTYQGITTGAPVSLLIHNTNVHSQDYDEIANLYRPGHADYTLMAKFGIRDPRGGGRSSGRETVSRVAAGVVAEKILSELGVSFYSYTSSIGPIHVPEDFLYPDMNIVLKNQTSLPIEALDKEALKYIATMRESGNSTGGSIRCIVKGFPAGIGDPVFDKLDANIAKAMMSIGAVKAVEIGDGVKVSLATALDNNDEFINQMGQVTTRTNHCGGILGGISNGNDILVKLHVKPTPSISSTQQTVNINNEETSIEIKGRHDPVIVPRAVIVAESMLAITLVDTLFSSLCSDMNQIKRCFSDLPICGK